MENADGEARRVLCDVRCLGETLLLYCFSGETKDEDELIFSFSLFLFLFCVGRLVVFSLFGLFWIKYVKKDVDEMQNKPLRDWHVHKLNEEERVSE